MVDKQNMWQTVKVFVKVMCVCVYVLKQRERDIYFLNHFWAGKIKQMMMQELCFQT